MAELKYAKELQPSYDLVLSHNGTGMWADNFAVRMIERIDRLMGENAALKAQVERLVAPVSFHDAIDLIIASTPYTLSTIRLSVKLTEYIAARAVAPATGVEQKERM